MLESEINSNMAVNEEASEVNVGISGAYLGGQLDVLSQACDVSRGKINPVKIAEIILRDHKIIYSAWRRFG